MIDSDTRGVDALYGDIVAELPPVIWFQIVNDLGPPPPVPQIDPFDEGPWRELPQIDELVHLWNASPVDYMIHSMVVNMPIDDVPKFLAQQRFMAQIEVDLIKERQAHDVQSAAAAGDDPGAAVQAAAVVSADAVRGGQDFPGEPEDGVAVVEGGQAAGNPHDRKASQIPRRRRHGKAAGRSGPVDGCNASEDTAAAF